jgi:hypothetical protein
MFFLAGKVVHVDERFWLASLRVFGPGLGQPRDRDNPAGRPDGRDDCRGHRGCGLGIWPRLIMPAGKTILRGASCLGTAKFGGRHRLQVTYHGKRLYTFVGDMGHSVNGNGMQGFKVAKVIACRPIPRPIPGP